MLTGPLMKTTKFTVYHENVTRLSWELEFLEHGTTPGCVALENRLMLE